MCSAVGTAGSVGTSCSGSNVRAGVELSGSDVTNLGTMLLTLRVPGMETGLSVHAIITETYIAVFTTDVCKVEEGSFHHSPTLVFLGQIPRRKERPQ